MQDFVVAFMMGLHCRLGADSPVSILGDDITTDIAKIFMQTQLVGASNICLYRFFAYTDSLSETLQ
jgi:hypothetical protein